MSDPNWSTVFVALIVLILSGIGDLETAEDATFERFFQTEQMVRQSKAQEIRRQMKPRADPCHDFYDYACGNWQSHSTPQAKQQQRIDNDLLRLLDELPNGKDSLLARQAKEFYKSCVDAPLQHSHSQQQQLFLSEFIQSNGGFPASPGSNWQNYHAGYDWLQTIARLLKYFGMDILIGLRVGYNYARVQENSLYLTEPSTLFPRELCSQSRLGIRDAAYVAIEERVTAHLRSWLSLGNEDAVRVAAEIVSFEHELCGGMRDGLAWPWNAEQQIYVANYTRKSLNELEQVFGIDFQSYVTHSYGQSVLRPVYMAAPEYYRQLKRTVDAHNSSHVANYIMYRAMAAISFPLDDKPADRPGYCLARMKQLLPSALGELYARQYASNDALQQLQHLYENLKDALKQSVSAEWLEEGSRRIAQRKLNDLKLELPNYEKPLSLRVQLDRKNYWQNLRQLLTEVQAKQLSRLFEEDRPLPGDPVEAYETRVVYRPVQQRLELGWALLQPPEYDARYGNVLRYATLGVALAEQMAMAFDEQHWSKRLLEQDNWDWYTQTRYQNRSLCFRRQVEDYLRINATATRQLIAGSAALNVAFRAYLNWLRYLEPNNDYTVLSKETLPGLNYSNTALFFIAFAQQHCRPREQQIDAANPWANINYSVRQHHSWTKFEVNGPLCNLRDFVSDYRCAMGTPMNPAKKCLIY